MAQYISGNIKGLAGVRCDLISQATGLRIESTHSVWKGKWQFNKPTPGLYDIKFYGRDVTESSWLLNYEVNPDDTYLGGEVTYAFWNGTAPYDDSKIVKENEFGWFNQSQLKFHIAGGGENPNINIAAINYRIFYNGSWTAWIPDAPGVPATTHEMDVDIAVIANIEGENNIIEFYVAFEDGTQDMVTTVPFKYDDIAPTFDITAGTASGGWGEVSLNWIINDISDALSGIGYIVIYRATSDVFGSAVEVGKITIIDQSIIPNTFYDLTLPKNDITTNYYYWGKAQDRAGNLSPASRLNDALTNTLLILPADVDGALRIVNNPDGVSWNVNYGIRVPIQAVIITMGTLSNVTEITAIQYKADDDDTWHDVTNPLFNGVAVSFPHSISTLGSGENRTILFDVVEEKKYWRVVFDHADAETEIALVHFESILAADIIVGGYLRLEKALSIWTGGFDANGDPTGQGIYMYDGGIRMWDALGVVNMSLNSDGSAAIGKSGSAQILVSTDGLISIDSSLLHISATTTFDAGYDPAKMRQVFTSEPVPPYYVDDLWMDGTDIFITDTERVPPAGFNAGDWELATDYDNSGDKSTRWRQPSTNDPSSGWSAQEKLDHEGDQWVKTDLGNKLFTWTGAAWIQDYTEIDGGHIDTYSIDADKLSIGAVSWTTNIIFEPDDSSALGYRYLKWNSGTIKFSNGETRTTIPLGTLKAVSNPRSWAYHNEATNTILLTATYSDAVGIGKTLLAIVDRGDVGGLCIINPIFNTGTTIDGDKVVTGKISSINGNTYFDLINNEIVMADGRITGVVAIDSELLNINSDTIFSPGYDPSKNNRRWYLPSGSNPTADPEWTGTDESHKGDQWVKTDLGNKLFTWTGTSWVADYTQIDGGSITTGVIQSYDGKTYFDLANNLFKVNKNIDRVVIGKMATNVYGMKIFSAANVLMFQIDDNTQKITSADGNTYFDLGNNILVMENGTITAGTITGATIKTASANNRVELTSNGIRIYRSSGGAGGAGAHKLNFYDGSTWRGGITVVNASGFFFENDTGQPFRFFAEDVQIDNDLKLVGTVDNVKVSEIFAIPKQGSVTVVTNNLQNTASQSHVVITGANAVINRIFKGIDGQVLILETSSVGGIYTLQHGVSSSGNYHGILAIDGADHEVGGTSGRKMRLLMYSGQRSKWMLLNAD